MRCWKDDGALFALRHSLFARMAKRTNDKNEGCSQAGVFESVKECQQVVIWRMAKGE